MVAFFIRSILLHTFDPTLRDFCLTIEVATWYYCAILTASQLLRIPVVKTELFSQRQR